MLSTITGISLVLFVLLLTLILYVGIKLATDDHGIITDETNTNRVVMASTNKLIGCLYIVGSLIAAAIVLF